MKDLILTTTISTAYTPALETPLKHACLRKPLLCLGDETHVSHGERRVSHGETRLSPNETRLPFCQTRVFQGGL